MSGVAPDPLDRIARADVARRLRVAARLAGPRAAELFNEAAYLIEIQDSLVEVARAARAVLESRLWQSGDGTESWQKANDLAAALARLDKQAQP